MAADERAARDEDDDDEEPGLTERLGCGGPDDAGLDLGALAERVAGLWFTHQPIQYARGGLGVAVTRVECPHHSLLVIKQLSCCHAPPCEAPERQVACGHLNPPDWLLEMGGAHFHGERRRCGCAVLYWLTQGPDLLEVSGWGEHRYGLYLAESDISTTAAVAIERRRPPGPLLPPSARAVLPERCQVHAHPGPCWLGRRRAG